MTDFTRKLMNVWSTEGEQAAYDLTPLLLTAIEAEREKLSNQASAIRAFGRVLEDTDGVIARTPDLDPGLDVIEAPERPRLIIKAATEVWRSQREEWPDNADAHLVKVQDVQERLRTKGLDLGVKQPWAVIGTVLTSANGFKKVARNTFEYTPSPILKLAPSPKPKPVPSPVPKPVPSPISNPVQSPRPKPAPQPKPNPVDELPW